MSVPTRLLPTIHMTGDPSILDALLGPRCIYLDEVQGFMSEEEDVPGMLEGMELDGGGVRRRRAVRPSTG